MDVAQDWLAYLQGDHAGIPAYAGQLFSVVSTLRSWFLPVIDQFTQKPDLATIALLLVIVLVSLKILNMLLQTFMFWFRMARRLAFWGGLVALGLWMYTRGPEGMTQDLQYWYNAWNSEYKYWKDQEVTAKLLQQQRRGRKSGPFY